MPSVRDVLREKGGDVLTIDHAGSAREAALLMSRRRVGALIVLRDGQLVGIFTERDLLNRVIAEGRDPGTTRIADVMTTRVACCGPDTKLSECRTTMTTQRIRHLPVMDGNQLIGIISSGDILAREMKSQEDTIRFLQQYVSGPN